MHNLFFSLCFLMFCTIACSVPKEAEPIAFGKDQCIFCKMTIANAQFGAELITDKGRIYKYDAAECLINHLREDNVAFTQLFAVPFDKPKELSSVDDLHFLISPDFRSPMGANLAAFDDLKNLDEKYHAEIVDWVTLLKTLE